MRCVLQGNSIIYDTGSISILEKIRAVKLVSRAKGNKRMKNERYKKKRKGKRKRERKKKKVW